MNAKKIILSFLIAIAFGAINSVTVFAGDTQVAQVGDNMFTSLKAAVDAANDNTVQLLENVDITSERITISGKKLTLDLNGKEIKAVNNANILVTNAGELTLKDSSTNSAGKISATQDYSSTYQKTLIQVDSNSKFIMESGYIYAVRENAVDKGQFGVGVFSGSTITINGGKIEAGWYTISGNGSDAGSTTVNINGGELISTSDYSIYNPQPNSYVNVNDGVVYGVAGGIVINAGVLTVTGGTITSKGIGDTGNWGDGTGNLGNAAISLTARYSDVSAKIESGTVIAESDAVVVSTESTYTANLEVSGGKFSDTSTIAQYITDGYQIDSTTNTVVKSDVAQIGDVKYKTLQGAIDAAGDKAEIKLLSNTKEDITVETNKDITIDLNGFKLTNVNDHTIMNNGILTIADSSTNKAGIIDNVTHARGAFYNEVGATAYLNAGTYTRSKEAGTASNDHGGNSWYVILNHGTMTIEKDVNVTGTSKYSSLIENGWQDGTKNTTGVDSTLTINGGTFSGGLNVVKCDDYGILNIKNGTFSDAAQSLLLVWNVATIEGGMFNGDTAGAGVAIYAGYLNNVMDKGQVIITAGDFIGAINEDNRETAMTISGGTYSENIPSKYIADGFVLTTNTDGKYTPVEDSVDVTETAYDSGAFNNNTGIIRFLANVSTSENIAELGIFMLPTSKFSSASANSATSVMASNTSDLVGNKFCADLINIDSQYFNTPVCGWVIYKLEGDTNYRMEPITSSAVVNANNKLDYADDDAFTKGGQQ